MQTILGGPVTQSAEALWEIGILQDRIIRAWRSSEEFMTTCSPFDYLTADPANGPAGRRLSETIAGIALSLPNVRSVCELGCGNGYLAGLILARGLRVLGVDASESGIVIARGKCGKGGEFLCEAIDDNLPLKVEERFDLVVSSDVIEHLYRPQDLLNCAVRMLRPNGWLVIGTPYHGYLKNLALSLLDRWDAHHGVHWDGGHIKFFSVKSLSQMVGAAGFEVDGFRFFGRVPFLWRDMICIAKRGP
jgi:SAM-dependent methyltransferase